MSDKLDNYYSAEMAGYTNWSSLKHLAHSGKMYQHKLGNKTSTASQGAFRANHTCVLEDKPELTEKEENENSVKGKVLGTFAKEYVVYEDGKRDKRNKDYQAFCALHEGKTILSPKEYETVLGISEFVEPLFWQDLEQFLGIKREYAQVEQVLKWSETIDNVTVPMKGRPDLFCIKDGVAYLVDLKGVPSTEQYMVEREIGRMRYDGQLAHYASALKFLFGIKEVKAYIYGYESRAPYDCALFPVNDATMFAGEEYRMRLLRKLIDCTKKDQWLRRYVEPKTVGIPATYLEEFNKSDEQFYDGVIEKEGE